MSETWYEKHLDYEIETIEAAGLEALFIPAWNEKHLDCEIET